MAQGKLLAGQQYLVEDGIIVPYTQQMMDVRGAATAIGDAATEVTPHQEDSSQVRVYDLTAIQAAFATAYLASPVTVSVQFPPVLQSITVTCSTSGGNGASSTSGNGTAVGSSVSLSLSPRSTGSSSGSIMPDIQPLIREYFIPDAYATEVLFYTAVNPTEDAIFGRLTPLVATGTTITVTIASPGVFTWNSHGMANGDGVVFRTTGALPTGIVANTKYYVKSAATNTFRVAATSGGADINTSGSQSGTHTAYKSVKRWPQFRPESHTIILSGQSYTLNAEAGVQQQVSINSDDLSYSYALTEGYSVQSGLTVKTVQLPPTIHGSITLTLPVSHTALVQLNVIATITTTDEATWPSHQAQVPHSGGFLEATATAGIAPTSLAATTPSAIPTSGLYVKDYQTSFYRYGVNRVRAVVVDFSQFV